MSLHADREDRERAVTVYDRNLVVVAGAGTGKTSLLIERILDQVIEQDLRLDELAAITFTEKAAGEMRTRLEAALRRLVGHARRPAGPGELDPAHEADRAFRHLAGRLERRAIEERAEQALRDLPRALLCTIHAFCARILRSHPLQAGVDPGFHVDEGRALDGLRRETWERFLEGENGPEGTHAERWDRTLASLDLHQLQVLGFGLADFSLPARPGDPTLPEASVVLAPRVEETIAEIDALLPAGQAPAPGPCSYLDRTRSLLRTLLARGPEAFREALQGASYTAARKGESPLLEGDPPTARRLPEATKCAKRSQPLLRELGQVDDRLLSEALSLVRPFAEDLREEACRRGLLPFDALLGLTRDLLAGSPEVRDRVARRFRLLLVDEFQDTDPLQYEIVFLLAGSPPDGRDAGTREAALAPGKLFIVGDPKQSIYRFRRADISAYHDAVARIAGGGGGGDGGAGGGGEILELTTNWRSLPEIVEPLDPLFRRCLVPASPRDRDIEPGYQRMTSGRAPGEDGPRVEVWTIGRQPWPTADEARRAEGAAIAAWIATEHREGRLALDDVAILLRTLSSLELYSRPLQDLGIPVVTARSDTEDGTPDARQLEALLRALARPTDGPAVLGVLRSPLGATPDRELLAFAREPGTTWCYTEIEPDPARFPDLARAFRLLRAWHHRSHHLPPEELLAGLADGTPLLALQAAAADGAQRVARLRRQLDRLAQIAWREPACTLGNLVECLGSRERSRSIPAPGGGVKILTIHSAKGLEFPVVILPDLGRGPLEGERSGRPETEVAWLARGRGLAVRTGRSCSSGWVQHRWEEERHARAEAKRLFYVACTRARERLILPHAPRKKLPAGAWVRLLPWRGDPGSLPADGEPLERGCGIAHRILEPGGTVEPLPRAREKRDLPGAVERARAAAAQAAGRTGPAFHRPSGLHEDEDARLEGDGEPATPSGPPSLARVVGVALHDALERWDFRDAGALRQQVRAAVLRAGRGTDVDPGAAEREAGAVVEALLASELPAHLASQQILGRELPLLFRDGDGRAWSGTLDLLYRDPDGRLVVADYKTDHERRPARHHAQLEIYARGVSRIFPDEPAPARELVYLRLGDRVRIE